MQDYMKKNAQRGGQQNNASPLQAKETNGIPNSVLQDVFAGKRRATSEMMGHSQNLAPSIAAKMSRAFGMDLTGMQVYQSDAMKGTGMRGMAQGNKVVLSSDVNLNTTAGQAVLGHELSHIHAQSQGIGMGHSGLYENAALEHQADTEGLLAAQGRSIYQGGMDTGIGMSYGLGMQGVEGMTAIGGGMSTNAGAPMQAGIFKPDNREDANQMVYDYATKLASKLNVDKLAQENKLVSTKQKVQKDLKKYVRGLHIPSDVMEQLKERAGGSKEELKQQKEYYFDDLMLAANGDKKNSEYLRFKNTDKPDEKPVYPYQNILDAEKKNSNPLTVGTGTLLSRLFITGDKYTRKDNINYYNELLYKHNPGLKEEMEEEEKRKAERGK